MNWIDLGGGEYQCPKCRNTFINGMELKIFSKYFPLCPICGAEMRGSENGR